MRLFAGIAAAAVVIAACGGTAAAPSPSPTRAPTTAPTTAPTPTPSPTPANIFKAELKASNENPPIVAPDPEATCSGTATVTLTATSAKFDVSITGCPASTVINIGHIHEGAAGVNGMVMISSTLKAGDITLTGGAVTFSRTNSALDQTALDTIPKVIANPAGYYVNFHSTLHGGGVIRGQLTKA